jgi:tetratricopeptide (TPR) repeat protein
VHQSEAHTRALSLLDRGHADQDVFAERLSPAERIAVGELHAWTAKDQIAHNNFWREDAIVRLRAALDGTVPPDTESDEAETLRWNDRNFEAQRDTPWDELVAETTRLHALTAELIGQFTEEELTTRERYQWQRGMSLQGLIFTNWYDHPAEHWADFYLGRGEVDRALELRRSVAATARELFAHDLRLYSFMAFKLGEMSATNGRRDEAVGALRDAVEANPSLEEMVRKEFGTLYNG